MIDSVPHGWDDVVLVALVCVTSYTDERYHRIRNVHTGPALLLGLVLHGVLEGSPGLISSLLGVGAGFLGLWVLYAIGVMKAGDLKLAMAIGALVGPGAVLRSVVLSFILFLPVGLLTLALRGRLGQVWIALKRVGRWLYTALHPALERESMALEGVTMAPYGMVLGVASLLVHFLGWIGSTQFFGR